MKRKITLLLLAAGSLFTMNSQVMIQENFTSPFNPNTNGWSYQNLTPSAGQNWFQGNSAVFSSFNGGANDYLACNWASSTNTVAGETLSNWLISPVVTIANGAVLEFATRTNTNPASFPDRLEVYYSTAGAGTNVGTTPTSVGTFSNLLVSVNPNLTTTGYPDSWTVYTATITGLPASSLGRIAFRYFVTNGGPAQAAVNSDFIGIDAVKYFIPCGVTVQSYSICSGGSATLSAVGAAPASTYTWAAPASSNNSSVVVTPGATTTYSLDYDEGNGACPTVTAEVVISNSLSVNVTATSMSICPSETITLTASSAAASYSWMVNPGVTTNTMAVFPNATTIYTVIAYNGTFPAITCAGVNTIEITVLPIPTATFALTPTLVCEGTSYTLTGSGAAQYVWLNSPTTGFPVNPLVLTAGTAGPRSYTLFGIGVNGCVSNGVQVSFDVNPNPTVSVSSSTTTACINNSVTLTATGADNYSWAGAGTSTANPYVFATGATAGQKTFTVTGTTTAGCTHTVSFTQTVVACNFVGVPSINGNEETAIFPNPFTNEIKINALEGNVVVYNAIGQVVVSTKVQSSESINTTELPKGAYLVKAYNSNGELVKTVKLIKN